jgi:hypothetical protein
MIGSAVYSVLYAQLRFGCALVLWIQSLKICLRAYSSSWIRNAEVVYFQLLKWLLKAVIISQGYFLAKKLKAIVFFSRM